MTTRQYSISAFFPAYNDEVPATSAHGIHAAETDDRF
jgi:hypothetical protein